MTRPRNESYVLSVRLSGPAHRALLDRAAISGRPRGTEARAALEYALLQHEPVDIDSAEPHLIREDFVTQEVLVQVLYALLVQSGLMPSAAIAQTKRAIERARIEAERRIGALLMVPPTDLRPWPVDASLRLPDEP